MDVFQVITVAMVGLGLAASCGFRVFVPLLFMSVAEHAGMLHLGQGMEWVGSWPAMIMLAVATVLEVVGYLIPWFDHALDLMATPAAVVAGILAAAGCLSDVHPMLQWSFAIIAGGGAAAVVQSGTVLARGASTATTGGAGNILVAGSELVSSMVLSLLAIVVPFLACLLFLAFAGFTTWLFIRWRRKKHAANGSNLVRSFS